VTQAGSPDDTQGSASKPQQLALRSDQIGVGALRPSEVRAATDVLARAFADNPVNVAVIGGSREDRIRCNPLGMRALLPVALRHGEVFAARAGTRVVGCLIATPPLGHPLPPPSIVARLRCRIGQGKRITLRWAEAFRTLDDLHPREPHWYVGSLGVAPEAQRQGVGAALLARFLRCADIDGLPGYLETDRHENVSFYQGRGFRVEERTQVLGVPTWRMWRPGPHTPLVV
jgi:GNAT superfamily N-acetyltransferase